MPSAVRIGIDLGGTKTAIIALDEHDMPLIERRAPTPRGDYDASIATIGRLIADAEAELGCTGQATVGVAMPGSISPSTGKVQNANSVWLNGREFDADLTAHLGRPVRLANDANCLALSESVDGAAEDARSVFAVILGTGCGGGFVHKGELVNGPRGIAGEWGHNPLPWPDDDERTPPRCWCGLSGCMEGWVSGPALYRDYLKHGGDARVAADAAELCGSAERCDAAAQGALNRHMSRLARGLAMVVNILDPEIIVLGGGLSRMNHLYDGLSPLMSPFIFADCGEVTIRPARHGDASGVRGAARLWSKAGE
ncbi:MAG: ROK family protein [Rhodomicrobiaceae bacterium]